MTGNQRGRKLAPRRQWLIPQNAPPLRVVGHHTFDGVPELRAVVHDLQMAEFVGDDVVDHVQLVVDQPPI